MPEVHAYWRENHRGSFQEPFPSYLSEANRCSRRVFQREDGVTSMARGCRSIAPVRTLTPCTVERRQHGVVYAVDSIRDLKKCSHIRGLQGMLLESKNRKLEELACAASSDHIATGKSGYGRKPHFSVEKHCFAYWASHHTLYVSWPCCQAHTTTHWFSSWQEAMFQGLLPHSMDCKISRSSLKQLHVHDRIKL